ncbi:MAG TPA: hypothetical protein VG796_07255 [Verrucomicrobiales bacterium]|nr:hypothetical protein [Verrucomicrobiales bacterium]
MSEKSLNVETWQRREALRNELAAARRDMAFAADSLKHSLNPKERAQVFIRERPLVTVLTALTAGAVAVKILPGLLWRSKGKLLSRFAGEMVRGAAGMMLPIIAGKIAAVRQTRPRPHPYMPTDPLPTSPVP